MAHSLENGAFKSDSATENHGYALACKSHLLLFGGSLEAGSEGDNSFARAFSGSVSL
jgi:hypothetical protein